MSKQFAQEIADEFVDLLDTWYALPAEWDDDLDKQIHEWYADPPNVWPKHPYFSPSSANACPRELYYKLQRAPKDSLPRQPHQGRWTEIGTAVGSIIQRAVLAIERRLEERTGQSPQFRFEKNDDGTPMFEDFAKKNHRVEYGGHKFYLYGTCDGILEYISEDGEIIRVGLEVKTKQNTPSKTSKSSMQSPDASHVKQCISYAEMYNVNFYIILYVNTSHKNWTLSDEDYRKTPDIRAFGLHITDEDKAGVFDHFVEVLDARENEEPPRLDIDKWTFNNYKTAIALELTPEEVEELQDYAFRVAHSDLPGAQRARAQRAVDDIVKIREEEF